MPLIAVHPLPDDAERQITGHPHAERSGATHSDRRKWAINGIVEIVEPVEQLGHLDASNDKLAGGVGLPSHWTSNNRELVGRRGNRGKCPNRSTHPPRRPGHGRPTTVQVDLYWGGGLPLRKVSPSWGSRGAPDHTTPQPPVPYILPPPRGGECAGLKHRTRNPLQLLPRHPLAVGTPSFNPSQKLGAWGSVSITIEAPLVGA